MTWRCANGRGKAIRRQEGGRHAARLGERWAVSSEVRGGESWRP